MVFKGCLLQWDALSLFFFLAYERIADFVRTTMNNRRGLSVPQDLLVSYLAGVINMSLTNPLWVTTTQLKLAAKNRGTDLLDDTMSQTVHTPVPGFVCTLTRVLFSGEAWKGLDASIVLCINPAIFYGIFEQTKRRIVSYALNAPLKDGITYTLDAGPAFFTGAFAKLVATILTYPLQLVQTQAQQKGFNGGMLNAFRVLAQRHGFHLPAYFTGMQSKIMMTVLNSALVFMTKERAVRNTVLFKRWLATLNVRAANNLRKLVTSCAVLVLFLGARFFWHQQHRLTHQNVETERDS